MADCGIADVYEPAADEEVVRLVRRRRGGRGAAAHISMGRSFKMTAPVDWTKICTANLGRPIEPINLMSLMINKYKGEGRYVTMDSAYMGDIMAQVGREVWGMNMVGTVQCTERQTQR